MNVVRYGSDNGMNTLLQVISVPISNTFQTPTILTPFCQAILAASRQLYHLFQNFATPTLVPLPLQAHAQEPLQGQNTCGSREPPPLFALSQQGGQEHEKWAEEESSVKARNAVLCLYPLL